MTVLGLDCSVAGISGDMTIAGLLQLIPDPEGIISVLVTTINEVCGTELEIHLVDKAYRGINGKQLEMKGDRVKLGKGKLLETYNILSKEFNLTGNYQKFGKVVIESLIETEKLVHDDAHIKLHELGTLDTLIDAIFPAYLFQKLKTTHVEISPVATGKGTSVCKHGFLPVPTPVTQILLEKGKFLTITGTTGELTTPTGAAILYSLINLFPKPENTIWSDHAYGYGQMTFEDRGNFLRIRFGSIDKELTKIVLLETNIDDISGEIMGDTVTKLLDAGALDVNYFPIYMKKNRPAYCLRVLCENSLEDPISDLIMKYTGTLGVRVQYINRHIGKRRVTTIKHYIDEFNSELTFRVKRGIRDKIEFEDLKHIGEEFDMSPLQVEEILRKYIKVGK